MPANTIVGFIGAGRSVQALARGLLNGGTIY